MKLQNLTVIFAIIIIPVTLILSAYIGSQIDTASLQQSYDTKLKDATHDAVVAFELNTQDNAYSNNSDSIRRDLQAVINTFSGSLASGLNIPGANQERIMPYIPAILITLYDGYYIYSPSEYSYSTKEEINGEWTEVQKTGYTHILKPYVYYSARYESGDNYVVVNYSLDNYITIYGTINGEVISNSGYLTTKDALNEINADGENLSEIITYRYNNKKQFHTMKAKFIYQNGRKVYHIVDEPGAPGDNWYYLNDIDLLRYTGNTSGFNLDYSAKEYKDNAITFNNWIKENTQLKSIVTPQNAVKIDGTKYEEFQGDSTQILTTNGEDPASAFNQHKRRIIQLSIQDNLNNAIAIYNANSGAMGTHATFRMPKLNELDWEKILTNVNIVTFMQGLPAGNTIFNSYAIVTSTNNKQYVSPSSIYIVDNDNNTYHAINCDENELNNSASLIGFKSADFIKLRYEGKTEEGEDVYKYYYRRQEYASYGCIVDSTNTSLDVTNIKNPKVRQAYYTALARERCNLDKVTKIFLNYNSNS